MRKPCFAGISMTVAVGLSVQLAWPRTQHDDISKVGKRSVAHRSIISVEKEAAIGKEYAREVDRRTRFIVDPVIHEYVSRLAQTVARNSDLKIPLTVEVIDSPEISALTLPGGYLYLSAGLIFFVDQEGELAGALAHEIAHLAARHWASMVTKAEIAQYAMLPLLFLPIPPSFGVCYGVLDTYLNGIPLAFLMIARSAEAEADYLGIQYMYKAGYDPSSYLAFLSKIGNEERRRGGKIPQIFTARPPARDRILKSEKEIKAILPPREQSLVSTSELEDVKARLQTLASSLRRIIR